jgi:hypothetical protein
MDSSQPAALTDDEIKAAFENLRAGDESARDVIFDGNLDWLSQLTAPLMKERVRNNFPISEMSIRFQR